MRPFLGLLLSLFVLPPAIASNNLQNLLNDMEVKNQGIRNIQFDFHQEIQFFNTNGKSELNGVALFQKPGQLRIHKKKPEEQLTISNGKKMWVYTPAYKQVWVGGSKNWMSASFLPKGMVPLDNFVQELKKNFNLALDPSDQENRPEFILLAEPQDATMGYRLKFHISKSTGLPIKTIFESETAKIVTDLLNTQVNLDIPTGTFRFTPPKGTEEIPL